VSDETPRPFNLMLRRPGSRKVFLSPGYDDPDEWLRRDFYDGTDEREDKAADWSLSLPHQCGEWGIWGGPREDVLDAARRFRTELDQAIAALEAAGDPPGVAEPAQDEASLAARYVVERYRQEAPRATLRLGPGGNDPLAVLGDIRIDVSIDGNKVGARTIHLPTGIAVEAPGLGVALAKALGDCIAAVGDAKRESGG
jgi:hypothetical protein